MSVSALLQSQTLIPRNFPQISGNHWFPNGKLIGINAAMQCRVEMSQGL
jgi:hypothetical protein